MHPKRQDILLLLESKGPHTAKMISDALGMNPSSAKHHINRLIEIGLVEEDRSERIRNIIATYYRHVPVTITFLPLEEHKRRLVGEFLLARSAHLLYAAQQSPIDDDGALVHEHLSATIHLSRAEAEAAYRMLRTFIDEHQSPTLDSEPYHLGVVASRL